MITVSDLVKREHGHSNWVLARRSNRVLCQYGESVICLSQKQYRELDAQAEYENASEHPATTLIDKLIRENYPATGFIRALRAEGWRIEKVYEK